MATNRQSPVPDARATLEIERGQTQRLQSAASAFVSPDDDIPF
jgi:hypothetical protein